jgi:uncharacterized heparinase superfamily protein
MKSGGTGKSVTIPGKRNRLRDLVTTSKIYQSSLGNRVPRGLNFQPRNPWPGDGNKADAIFRGSFDFAGDQSFLANKEPWFVDNMSATWHQNLHGFNWLRDFADNGSEAGCRHAIALTTSWLRHFDKITPIIWDRECLRQRVENWICHSDFLLGTKQGEFRNDFLKCLRQQCEHLFRLYKIGDKEQKSDLQLIATLIYACLCFKDFNSRTEPFLKRLSNALSDSIRIDGGHRSRNPEKHVNIVGSLIGLEDNLLRAGMPVPEKLTAAIKLLSPLITFFQHGDGKLAVFNGGLESTVEICQLFTKRRPEPEARSLSYRASGFEKMVAGKSKVIIDIKGGPYAGASSFEFSDGPTRLVVNCGTETDDMSEWYEKMATTPCHSTLCFNGLEAKSGTNSVHRTDEKGHCLIDIESRSYFAQSLIHERQIYLSPDGLNLRGEDQLKPVEDSHVRGPFALRFHIHPANRLSLSQGGKTVFIQPKKGPGWRFLSNCPNTKIGDSVYAGEQGNFRRTQQIVLSGHTETQKDTIVKWAFNRV